MGDGDMMVGMGKDSSGPTMEDALRPLVEKLVQQILAKHAPSSGWITHAQSPLGRVKTAALCRSGALPAKRVTGTKLWLIRTADLEAYIHDHSVGANDAEPDEGAALMSRLHDKGARVRRAK